MKRDMDLVRKLLLYVEAKHTGNGFLHIDYDALSNWDEEKVYGHLIFLSDGGLLKSHHSAFYRMPLTNGLTLSGHDFLDSIRDPEIWQQTKDVAKKAGGWTVDILADIAKGLIKTKIKKHTGVEI